MNSLMLAAGDVMAHLENSWDLHMGPWHLDLNALINNPIYNATGFNPMVSKHVVMMMLASLCVGALCIMTARRAVKDKGRGLLANMVEATALFLRDEVAKPGLGEHHYKRWYAYVATIFFFVLGCNLIGLLPPPLGATATGNINVTAGLALLTLLMMVIGGMMEHGAFKFWISLVPHGVPLWLFPIIWAIEVFGLLTKPFALMVRLFANMTAGHVILAVLAGFLYFGDIGLGAFLGKMVYVGVPTVGFYLFITIFEIAIAFIQAFIFAYLSAIFIGLMVSHEH
jgi:F-type H+-transporting ATPase subunit a